MMDMSGMALMMLIGALVLLVALVGAVYIGVRALRGGEDSGEGSARAVLDQRLATGEIGPDEYYEREAALRDAQPLAARRRARR